MGVVPHAWAEPRLVGAEPPPNEGKAVEAVEAFRIASTRNSLGAAVKSVRESLLSLFFEVWSRGGAVCGYK